MATFFEIPSNIREHLISPRTTILFDKVTKDAEIYEVGILPDIVSRLVMRDILPQDFIARLKEEVGVSEEKAKVVAKELKEKILEPIRYALVNWGVDINQIDVSDVPTLDEFLKAKKEKEEKRNKLLASLGIEVEQEDEKEKAGGEKDVVTFDTLGAAPTESSSVRIHPEESDVEKKEGEEIKPLMIHRENQIETARPRDGSKSFSLPFGFFKKVGGAALNAAAPIKARIEAPGDVKRTVHYSELRTPVSPFQKGDSFIDPTFSFGAPQIMEKKVETQASTKELPKEIFQPAPEEKKEAPQEVKKEKVVLKQEKKEEAPIANTPADKVEKIDPANTAAPLKTKSTQITPPIQKKSWGFSLLGNIKKSAAGSEETQINPVKKQENTSSQGDLSLFFSDVKKDIELENKKAPEAQVAKLSNQPSQKKESGPHIEGNTVDLR